MTIRYILTTLVYLTVLSCKPSRPAPEEPDTARTVYISSDKSTLYAIDATNGTRQWEFIDEDALRNGYRRGNWSSPTVANEIVYVHENSVLFAIDAATGAKKWRYVLEQDGPSVPLVANGIVYTDGGMNQTVYALDAATGRKRWQFKTGGRMIASPTIAKGILYVATAEYDGKLYALDAASGTQKWEFKTGNIGKGGPSVVNGVIYVASDMNLYALDAMTGLQKWKSEGFHFSPALTVAGGIVYATDMTTHTATGYVYVPDGTSMLHAIDAATGKTKWESMLDFQVITSPIVANAMVYVASYDAGNRDGNYKSTLYALDTATGSRKWVFKNSSSISSSPTVVSGTVFLGVNDEKLYALDALTGAKRWATPVDGILNSSPCVVTKKGVVYESGISGAQP